ncbi:MAG: DUF4184 family protein [Candidatus Obscuribacterales bacterium]|nr:DUF4184 family protein [Candidatus Obscuribacterales bacterium]
MPFTFAHPAAVLPLRKLAPRFFSMPALIVGSMVPDCGYYLHNWLWSTKGHSFIGSLTFDLPAGLLALALLYLNIRPLSCLLPSPYKEALLSACPKLSIPSLRALLIAAASIVVGAWTHIVWDGFTHANGWCVHKFAAVTPTLVEIGSYKVTVWHLLQHASTAFGLVVLLVCFHKYAKTHFAQEKTSTITIGQRLLLGALLTIPAIAAMYAEISTLSTGLSLERMDVFTFNSTVRYVCILLPLLSVSGIIAGIYELRKQKKESLKDNENTEQKSDPERQPSDLAMVTPES